MRSSKIQSLTIWYITDDKPGHLNQILGLIDALKRQLAEVIEYSQKKKFDGVNTFVFSTRQRRRMLFIDKWSQIKALAGFAPDISLPEPQLIIGAGHTTHWSVIAASRAFKVPSVILMKPSLPLSLFNYVIVPTHDGLTDSDKIFTTQGAVNRIRPAQKTPHSGIILLGGPSKHFSWDNVEIAHQLQNLIQVGVKTQWNISTSRRTPQACIVLVTALISQYNNVKLIKFENCEKNWLHDNLAKTEQVWVTPDSVSMVFEGLSSGARVGIFEMKALHSKVSRSILNLIDEHQITTTTSFFKNKEMYANNLPLNEATRAAEWLLEKIDKTTDAKI